MNSAKGLGQQSDESAQGVILRVMLRNGWGDFTTLITNGEVSRPHHLSPSSSLMFLMLI